MICYACQIWVGKANTILCPLCMAHARAAAAAYCLACGEWRPLRTLVDIRLWPPYRAIGGDCPQCSSTLWMPVDMVPVDALATLCRLEMTRDGLVTGEDVEESD